MKESKELEVFRSAAVPKAVLKTTIPAMIAMLRVLIYNLADTFFIGLTRDPYQLAAVSMAMPVFFDFHVRRNDIRYRRDVRYFQSAGGRTAGIRKKSLLLLYVELCHDRGASVRFFSHRNGTNPDDDGNQCRYA